MEQTTPGKKPVQAWRPPMERTPFRAVKTFAVEMEHATRRSEMRLEFARAFDRAEAIQIACRKWQGFVVVYLKEL
jgi:hypothetical protein